MKSYVSYLQGLYSAMFVDIAEHFPSLRLDSERDVSRLLSLIESRGISFLMIDLPDMGKHFDRCLSQGRLTRSGIAGQRPYRSGGVIPQLFKGLLLRVFDEVGLLRAVPDVDCIRYLRQLYYAGKKVKVQCSDSKTWKHVNEFFETDREVRLGSLSWDSDELGANRASDLHIGDHCDVSPVPLFDSSDELAVQRDESLSNTSAADYECVQRVADIVSATIGRFDPSEWRTKHGPGAVADQRSSGFKYDFPCWPAKLESVFPMAEFGFANLSEWAAFSSGKGSYGAYSLHEPPSKLIAVPKTLKGPRLIAAEPVAHQWCQQAILDFFTSRLQQTPIFWSIHFRDQTENQEFARRASHTQSHVTVDLSSASDRLSCWLVERIFRRNESLLNALHASRTRWVSNEIDRKSPGFHKLRKFACMGSACTFPVQSIVFTILAIASLASARDMAVTIRNVRTLSREVRVFGDDIVIPEDGWKVLQGLLGNLGLKVNHSKTYDSGNFRESCGLDAYDGHNVTPTYSITYPDVSRPESISSCVETHNNFVSNGLFRTAEYVQSRVLKLGRLAIAYVPIGSGAFGWYDLYNTGNQHLKRRWNTDLHRIEYRADIPFGRSTRLLPKSDSILLQAFTVSLSIAQFVLGDRLGVVSRTATTIRRRWVTL
jgi:hypothetical protein